MHEELIDKAVREIAGREREIIDQFAKTFVAAKSLLTETDVAWLITHLKLNQKQTFQDEQMIMTYWFSFSEDDLWKTE